MSTRLGPSLRRPHARAAPSGVRERVCEFAGSVRGATASATPLLMSTRSSAATSSGSGSHPCCDPLVGGGDRAATAPLQQSL